MHDVLGAALESEMLVETETNAVLQCGQTEKKSYYIIESFVLSLLATSKIQCDRYLFLTNLTTLCYDFSKI